MGHAGSPASRDSPTLPLVEVLPVRVLSALFRRLMLEKLAAAHAKGQLRFYGEHRALADGKAFAAFLAPLRNTRRFVYSKEPFAGPSAVLAYLSRYTHRVAIANSRLIKADEDGVTFRWKNYRQSGHERFKTMTLQVGEFIRRFLLHVLPQGFHRIRHHGLLANAGRVQAIAKIRDLLSEQPIALAIQSADPEPLATNDVAYPCPCCGGRLF